MRLISWNVNGIRAAGKKGLWDWFKKAKPDVFCLQETKARKEQVDPQWQDPKGYKSYWHSAQKAGYSGVAVYSKVEPIAVIEGIGDGEIDSEGRVLQLEYSDFTLLNCYFPNSQRDHARLGYKLDFCKKIERHCTKLAKKNKNILITGDFNIAHKEIDLKNPKTNQNNAGFLPQERAWLDGFLKKDFVDVFRVFEQGPDHYTWWSYRPGVRERNIGWRLDYFCANLGFKNQLKAMKHLTKVMGSDHCPIELQLK
jgi:exodeoxyribonuclease-3